MNPPQVYICSPPWTLPPPSPDHPSRSSQCTSPKHPVSCIEPGLATRFIHAKLVTFKYWVIFICWDWLQESCPDLHYFSHDFHPLNISWDPVSDFSTKQAGEYSDPRSRGLTLAVRKTSTRWQHFFMPNSGEESRNLVCLGFQDGHCEYTWGRLSSLGFLLSPHHRNKSEGLLQGSLEGVVLPRGGPWNKEAAFRISITWRGEQLGFLNSFCPGAPSVFGCTKIGLGPGWSICIGKFVFPCRGARNTGLRGTQMLAHPPFLPESTIFQPWDPSLLRLQGHDANQAKGL